MSVLHFIFHGLCHQLPSRSLSAGGFVMPACARCAGLYIALFAGLAFFLARSRGRSGMPTAAFRAVTTVTLAAYFVDGAANTFGLAATPPGLRFGTGALAGFFLAPYIVSLFRSTIDAGGGRPAAGFREAAALAGGAVILAAANMSPTAALLEVESFAAAGGLVLFLLMAHTAVLALAAGRLAVALPIAAVTVPAHVSLFAVLRGLAGM